MIVSTESAQLAEVAREHGASVPFLRPAELSQSDVLLNDVLDHGIGELEKDDQFGIGDETPIVVLQPNVPFTRPADVDEAIRKYEQNGQCAIISVVEEREFFWHRDGDRLEPFHDQRVLRSELEPLYQETGSFYVTNRSILAEGDRVGESPSYVVTDKLSAFEVDTIVDVWLAEKIRKGPSIAFRVDGGDEIGMGHVYRCLTLARELRDVLDCEVTFITHTDYPGGVEKLSSTEFNVVTVDAESSAEHVESVDPDVVFVDVLNTSDQFVRELHDLSAAVINLEDLGEGADHADYVINALYEHERDRKNRLSGADYVVLDDDYTGHKPAIRNDVENVLITFGGSDPSNLSTRVVSELGAESLPYEYRLVLGPDFEHQESIAALPESNTAKVEIERDVDDMATRMRWADVAVASGGRTVYELAATGTPTLVIAHNEREAGRMRDLDALDIIEFLGTANALEDGVVPRELVALDEDRKRRVELSENGREFVDGGGVQRILDLIHDILLG